MSEKDCVRFGVIGCGWVVNDYIYAITKKIDIIKIIAATDPILERAYKLVGKDHSYKDAENMYKNEDIDAVYIATPHHLHEPMIKQALEQGKHVFCEKPVSSSIESAREIYKTSKKYSNLKLGFNYQYRYDYNCYNLAEGVKKGHLGKIYYANCNIYFSRNIDYFNQSPWRAKMNTAGGGTLLIHGSHILDVIIWALGEPISVIGKVDNLKFKGIEVEDIGFGIIQFENGCYAQINDSMITKPKKKKFNELVELNVFGEKGSCYYEGPWPFSSLKWYGVENFKLKENMPAISDFGECIKTFAQWVLHNESFFNTIEESSKVLLLIKALYKSSVSGKKENVEKL